MIRPGLITREEDFLKLEPEWNTLLRQSKADNIFLTWEWVSTWWRVFGKEKSLYVLTFHQENELVGIVPLYLRKTGYYGILPVRSLMLLGTGESVRSEYLDLIVKPGREIDVIRSVLEWLRKSQDWDIAFLKDLRGESPLVSRFEDSPSDTGLPCPSWRTENCHAVKLSGSYPEYLKSLSKQLRKNINNRRRKLGNNYAVEYRTLDKEEEIGRWMGNLKELHQKRMREKGLGGKFSNPDYESFHAAIAELFFRRGWLRMAGLSLDSVPRAIRYGFFYGNKVYGYQTGFDPDFAREGVMQVLISRSIEEGFASGWSEIDFMAGGDPHKMRFGNAVRRIFTFTVFNKTVPGRVARAANRARALTRSLAKRRDWPSILRGPFHTVKLSRFFTRDLDEDHGQLELLPEVEIKSVGEDDGDIIAGIARLKNHCDERIIRERLSRGHRCLAAVVAGRPVAFIWIDTEAYHLDGDGPEGKLKPGEAFIYDCLTGGSWRGMGIYPLLLNRAAAELAGEGLRSVSMLINTVNLPAVRAAEKAGFRMAEGGFETTAILGSAKKVRTIPRA